MAPIMTKVTSLRHAIFMNRSSSHHAQIFFPRIVISRMRIFNPTQIISKIDNLAIQDTLRLGRILDFLLLPIPHRRCI